MQMWVCNGSDNAVCLHLFVKCVCIKIYIHVCVWIPQKSWLLSIILLV